MKICFAHAPQAFCPSRMFFAPLLFLLIAVSCLSYGEPFSAVTLDLEAFLLRHPTARSFDPQTRSFLDNGLASLSPEELKNEERMTRAQLKELQHRKMARTQSSFHHSGSDIFASPDFWKEISLLSRQEKQLQKKLEDIDFHLCLSSDSQLLAYANNISRIHDDLLRELPPEQALVLNLLPSNRLPDCFFPGPNPYFHFFSSHNRQSLKEYAEGVPRVRTLFPSVCFPILFPRGSTLRTLPNSPQTGKPEP